MKKRQGFTLIELILYVAVVTIMLSALIPLSGNIMSLGTKSTTAQELSANARYVSERIKYEIRHASGITPPVLTNSISLTNFSPDTTTVIDLSGNKIRINKNGAGPINLNSDDTTITSLNFTDYSSVDSKTKHIQFVFTITDNLSSARQEYINSVNIEGSAELRTN